MFIDNCKNKSKSQKWLLDFYLNHYFKTTMHCLTSSKFRILLFFLFFQIFRCCIETVIFGCQSRSIWSSLDAKCYNNILLICKQWSVYSFIQLQTLFCCQERVINLKMNKTIDASFLKNQQYIVVVRHSVKRTLYWTSVETKENSFNAATKNFEKTKKNRTILNFAWRLTIYCCSI